MDIENNKPGETQPVPAAPPAPEAKAPEAAAAAPAATPAPAVAQSQIAPQTKANAPGGWNRFAGYKRGAEKNKQKDRREGSKGRR